MIGRLPADHDRLAAGEHAYALDRHPPGPLQQSGLTRMTVEERALASPEDRASVECNAPRARDVARQPSPPGWLRVPVRPWVSSSDCACLGSQVRAGKPTAKHPRIARSLSTRHQEARPTL